MQFESTRFGPVEIPEERVIRFPRGLYGLDGIHSYCLLEHDEQGRFQWLQAIDAPAIAMIVTDPFLFFTSYEVEIPDSAAELLQATVPSDITLYTSITVSPDHQQIYTNLLGPIVINHRAARGMQVIQNAARYSTRHLIGSGNQAFGSSGVQGDKAMDTSLPVEPERRNARTPERLNA